MHHTYLSDCWLTKIQLNYFDLIDYRFFLNGIPIFDPDKGSWSPGNFETDKICHFNDSVLDSWFIGFGEQCSVCATVVEAINVELSTTAKNRSTGFVDKLLEILPEGIRSKILPMTSRVILQQMFDSKIPDHNECNPDCDPMPLPPDYLADDNGIRQVEAYKNAGRIDMGLILPMPDIMLNIFSPNTLNKISQFLNTPTLSSKKRHEIDSK